MTIEDRVSRLEQRIDQLDRIEARLGNVEEAIIGLRSDVDGLRSDVNGLRSDLNASAHAFGDRMTHFERGLNRGLFVFGTIQGLILVVLVFGVFKVSS